jgi:hypothetical protein
VDDGTKLDDKNLMFFLHSSLASWNALGFLFAGSDAGVVSASPLACCPPGAAKPIAGDISSYPARSIGKSSSRFWKIAVLTFHDEHRFSKEFAKGMCGLKGELPFNNKDDELNWGRRGNVWVPSLLQGRWGADGYRTGTCS